MTEPLVAAFTAEYSVNGTLAPVPLGTLNGESAQYGGVPAAVWAFAVTELITGRTAVPKTTATAATRTARSRPRCRAVRWRPLCGRQRLNECVELLCSASFMWVSVSVRGPVGGSFGWKRWREL